jgi:aminoglycoside phosphotransferase (APT) family kinase protein
VVAAVAVPEEVARLARRYGVAAGAVVPAAVQGVAGQVWLLGEELVLKLAGEGPGFAADLRKEAVVIPFAGRVGVRTAEVVELGDGDGDGPYVVLRRVRGRGFGQGEEPGPGVYRELGEQLALLHGAVVPAAVREGVPLDADAVADPRPGVERLVAAGYLGADVARWLTGWLDELAGPGQAPTGSPRMCLIHGDAAPTNLLVDAGRLAALLDWGDAAITDPAVEFAKVPPRALRWVLEGYVGGAAVEWWMARALWHHVVWAVGRLGTPPDPVAAHWSAQPGNRLLELLRYYAEGAADGWMRSQRLP